MIRWIPVATRYNRLDLSAMLYRIVNFVPDDADQLDNNLDDYAVDAKHDIQRLKACFRASKLKLP